MSSVSKMDRSYEYGNTIVVIIDLCTPMGVKYTYNFQCVTTDILVDSEIYKKIK